MTEIQELMLSMCCGAVIGMIVGNIVALIALKISDVKEKRRRRKEAESISKGK